MKTVSYERRVHYYETDRMGCVHHSNYIRWFEEARVHLMQELGFPYEELEDCGVQSPVVSIQCNYRRMCRFGETVVVETTAESYNGTRMRFTYTVQEKTTGEVRCTGESEHCFIRVTDGRPVSLKKAAPEFDEKVRRAIL